MQELETEVFGEIGSSIPGSKFYRSYCAGCGEPMRIYKHGVANAKRGLLSCCDVCTGMKDRETKDDRADSAFDALSAVISKKSQY